MVAENEWQVSMQWQSRWTEWPYIAGHLKQLGTATSTWNSVKVQAMATTVAFMTQHQIIMMVFVVVVCVCFCCCCCCCVCCCLCYINWVLIPISCTVVFPGKILKELLKTAWQNRSQTNFSTTDVKLTALKCKDVSVFGRRMRRITLSVQWAGGRNQRPSRQHITIHNLRSDRSAESVYKTCTDQPLQ